MNPRIVLLTCIAILSALPALAAEPETPDDESPFVTAFKDYMESPRASGEAIIFVTRVASTNQIRLIPLASSPETLVDRIVGEIRELLEALQKAAGPPAARPGTGK